MKTVNLILILGLFSFGINTSRDTSNKSIKVDVILRGSYKFPYNYRKTPSNDTINYFLVDFKLINISKNPIEFITHSCTTAGNIVTNNPAILVDINKCSNNHIKVIKLMPLQEFSLPIILESDNKTIFNVKLGWILLDPKKIDPATPGILSQSKIRPENIIWSESLYLDPSGGETFQIK